jgi:hypothetical protein
MAYDEGLAQRIRDQLGDVPDPWLEKKMFGGLCFMVRDHMAFGIVGEELMVRLGKDRWAEAAEVARRRPQRPPVNPSRSGSSTRAPG